MQKATRSVSEGSGSTHLPGIRLRQTGRFLSLTLLAALLTGCGEDPPTYDGPERAAVAGKVTLNQQPVSGGTIRFVPEDSKNRTVETLIAEGEYEFPEHMGPNLGAYKVEIRWSRSTDSGDTDPTENEGQNPALPPVIKRSETEAIPEKYNDKTELKEDIKSGENKFDYALDG